METYGLVVRRRVGQFEPEARTYWPVSGSWQNLYAMRPKCPVRDRASIAGFICAMMGNRTTFFLVLDDVAQITIAIQSYKCPMPTQNFMVIESSMSDCQKQIKCNLPCEKSCSPPFKSMTLNLFSFPYNVLFPCATH